MLAQNQDGHALVRMLSVPEAELSSLPALTHARVVARHDGKVLLVFDRRDQRWQLAGGGLERAENARECAVRELREESSNDCSESDLRYLGAFELHVAATSLNPEAHVEYGALFEVDVPLVAAFLPNEEIGATLWWNGSELSHELDAIDRKLIEQASAGQQRVA
jgi:8-oxo-dGTP diphosphatase